MQFAGWTGRGAAHHKILNILSAVLLSCALSACSGGSGGGSGGGSSFSGVIPIAGVDVQKVDSHSETYNDLSGHCTDDRIVSSIYESDNTITFAQAGVSDEAHQQMAIFAEASIRTIKTEMGITEAVGYVGAKIDVCATLDFTSTNGAGQKDSLQVVSFDDPDLASHGYMFSNNYSGMRKLIQHEAAHSMMLAVMNKSGFWAPFDHWFHEGLAEYLAGRGSVVNQSQWNAFFTVSNPLKVMDDGYDLVEFASYPYAETAVTYFFDSEASGGAGNSLSDLLDMLEAVAADGTCSVAPSTRADCPGFDGLFDTHFKMPNLSGGAVGSDKLEYFKDNYKDLVSEYLE